MVPTLSPAVNPERCLPFKSPHGMKALWFILIKRLLNTVARPPEPTPPPQHKDNYTHSSVDSPVRWSSPGPEGGGGGCGSEGDEAVAGRRFSMWHNCSQPLLLSIISVGWRVTSCGVSFIRDDDWLRDKTQGWHPRVPLSAGGGQSQESSAERISPAENSPALYNDLIKPGLFFPLVIGGTAEQADPLYDPESPDALRPSLLFITNANFSSFRQCNCFESLCFSYF